MSKKLKICLIGSEKTGKTSYLKRIIDNSFNEEYFPTIATYCTSKTHSDLEYEIWDSAGYMRYQSLSDTLFNNTHVLIGFYDLTNRASFDFIKSELSHNYQNDNDILIILVGNKMDLESEREIQKDEAQQFANENGFLFIEISVKENFNLNESLNMITEEFNKKSTDLISSSICGRINVTKSLQLPKISNSFTIAHSSSLTRSQVIDANSNSLLLSNISYHNKVHDSETRKIIADLADQIKFLKNELDRKDHLITQISTTRESARSSTDFVQAESMFTLSKIESYKKDFEAKYEKIAYELFEERAKTKLKDEEIQELKSEIMRLSEEVHKECTTKEDLALKLTELRLNFESCEMANSKSTLAITTLQFDIQQLQEKVLELESSLRSSESEKTELEQKCQNLSDRVQSFSQSITINSETVTNIENVDLVVSKFEAVKSENLSYKKQLTELKEKVESLEIESKTYKERCEQLTCENRCHETRALESRIQIANLKAERDAALSSKQIIESDIQMLQSKLSETQKVWLHTQKELDLKEGRYSSVEMNLKKIEHTSTIESKNFKEFKEECANLLTDDFFKCDSNEEEIKEKIKLLMVSSKHRGIMLASLEKQVQMLNSQLTHEISIQNESKIDFESYAKKISELESQRAEFELNVNELRKTIETFEIERNRVYDFLDKLVKIYKLPISSSAICQTSIEKNLELILNRVSKEVHTNIEIINSKKDVEFDKEKYDKKIKCLKEELSNKEIHLTLLRKKLTEYEEEKGSQRSDMRKEFDKHLIEAKKTNVKFERLVEEVNKLRSENLFYKSQLLDINQLNNEKNDKETEIKRLNLRILELEKENRESVLKIYDLRNEFETVSLDLDKTVTSTDSVIKSLSLEIKALKFEMEKLKSREQQLLDFRHSVCKKLGLNLSGLSIADYEIMARIEGLYTQCVPVVGQSLQLVSGPCIQAAQTVAFNPCVTSIANPNSSFLSSNVQYLNCHNLNNDDFKINSVHNCHNHHKSTEYKIEEINTHILN